MSLGFPCLFVCSCRAFLSLNQGSACQTGSLLLLLQRLWCDRQAHAQAVQARERTVTERKQGGCWLLMHLQVSSADAWQKSHACMHGITAQQQQQGCACVAVSVCVCVCVCACRTQRIIAHPWLAHSLFTSSCFMG